MSRKEELLHALHFWSTEADRYELLTIRGMFTPEKRLEFAKLRDGCKERETEILESLISEYPSEYGPTRVPTGFYDALDTDDANRL